MLLDLSVMTVEPLNTLFSAPSFACDWIAAGAVAHNYTYCT
jgi:hypothetical protein